MTGGSDGGLGGIGDIADLFEGVKSGIEHSGELIGDIGSGHFGEALDDGVSCQAWVANLSPQSLDIALVMPRATRKPSMRLAPYTWVHAAS